MDEKKIDFIICTNDTRQFEDTCLYIHSLKIPTGYRVDILEIQEAESIFSGYNEGMNASDAKYKIYIHQDVKIVNGNFLSVMLEKFEDPQVGMLGVVGNSRIETKSWNWDAGAVIETRVNRTSLQRFGDNSKDVYVKQIDGLLMATQYDLFWREDLFDGWDIYDCSQCCEFLKAGYKIMVPAQASPFCLHDCEMVDISNYNQAREKFLSIYSEMIM